MYIPLYFAVYFSIYLYFPLYFAVCLVFTCIFHCILRYISVPENAVFTSGRSCCMSRGSCERGKNQFIWTFLDPFKPKLIFYSKALQPMSTRTYIAIFLFLTISQTMQFSPPVPLHVSWIQRARKQISRTVFQSRNQKYILTEYRWWWVAQGKTSDIPQRTSLVYMPNY